MTTEKTSQSWFKITNEEENHHGFQYVDGLNILVEPFNDDPSASCCKGGFYFSDATSILKFVDYGCYLREITLPLTDPDFKMIKDPRGDKWRANKIIFGIKHDLWSVSTLEMLIKKGANLDFRNSNIMRAASESGKLEIIKFLIENGLDIHAYDDNLLRVACKFNHLDIIVFLVANGADIHAANESALRLAILNECTDVVKYLVEQGANININNNSTGDSLFVIATRTRNLEILEFLCEKESVSQEILGLSLRHAVVDKNQNSNIVKFLIKKGADVHVYDDVSLRYSAELGNLEMVKILVENGANVSVHDNWPLKCAKQNNHNEIVEFLLKNGATFE